MQISACDSGRLGCLEPVVLVLFASTSSPDHRHTRSRALSRKFKGEDIKDFRSLTVAPTRKYIVAKEGVDKRVQVAIGRASGSMCPQLVAYTPNLCSA